MLKNEQLEKTESVEEGRKRTFPATGKRIHLIGSEIRTGKRNGNWKGGIVVKKDGRTLLHSPEHPFCSKDGYVLRYRIVAEKKLGRYLEPKEIVHHINGDHTDDRPENLEVMTRGEHMRLHDSLKGRRFIPSKKGRWSYNFDNCIECGTFEKKHGGHGLCVNCHARHLTREKNAKNNK